MIELIFQIMNTLLIIIICYLLFIVLPRKIKIRLRQIDNIENMITILIKKDEN